MFVEPGVLGGNKSIDQVRGHFLKEFDDTALFKEFGDFAAVIRINRGYDGRMVLRQIRNLRQVLAQVKVDPDAGRRHHDSNNKYQQKIDNEVLEEIKKFPEKMALFGL